MRLAVVLLAIACDEATRPADLSMADAGADAVEKTVRDAYGAAAHVLLSPNFALKWGDEGQVATADAQALLEALERAWDVEIGAMGYPVPTGCEASRLNVYIGSTGPGTPAAFDFYAFASHDPDGTPSLIYSTQRVANVPKSVNSAAHEFLHTIQFSIGTLPGEEAAWWWEATATWMAEEVFPDSFDAGYLSAIGSYAMLPHLGLRHHEPPEAEWQLVQGHPYGAWIFARDLTEHHGDATLLRRSFVEAGEEPDALRVLERLLAERGESLVDVFGAFAARNTTWDYPDGEAYREALEAMAAAYPDQDRRFAEELPPEGVALHPAPAATLPEHAGYNVIRMAVAPAGDLALEFHGGAGSAGGAPEFRVTAVIDDGVTPRTLPLSLDGGRGEARIDGLAGGEQIYLTVAAWAWDGRPGEVFAYEYAVIPAP
jgi:hypothetical protein